MLDLETLSTEQLRRQCTMAHYFGLGFIQVKLNDVERLHFYHTDVPAYVEEPHNHRYNFVSKVIRGSLRNSIWSVVTEDDKGERFEVLDESCAVDRPSGLDPILVKARQIATFVTSTGCSYPLDHSVFHVAEPLLDEGPCITYLRRDAVVKTHAQVMRRPGTAKVCPFSRQIDDDELWKIVDKCLR